MLIAKSLAAAVAAVGCAALLTGCDRSAQNADGATNAGEVGVAASTNSGVLADTGRDTGAGGDIGGAGELGVTGGNSAGSDTPAVAGGANTSSR